MLFEANTGAAKAGVAELRDATEALAQEMRETGGAAGTAADGTAEWGSIVQAVRAQMQPMVAEANALREGMQQLAVAEEMGALTARESAAAHDMLTRQMTDLVGRMEAAGVTIDGTTASIARQDTALQQLVNAHTGVSARTDQTIADTLRHGQALDQLRAQFDPLFAASRQYEQQLAAIADAERQGAITAQVAEQARTRAAQAMGAMDDVMRAQAAAQREADAAAQAHADHLDYLQTRYNPLIAISRQYEKAIEEIAEAERLGVITSAQATQQRERAAMAMAPMPAQLQQIGASSGAAASYVANLGYQLNDIGMMMSLGQSPFMLMMQQGPQVVQVFGQMRDAGMDIGPAIGTAFRSMLSPMSLATMAVIGFGAAAVQWLTKGKESAKGFDDALGRLDSVISGLRGTVTSFTSSELEDLSRKYGEINEELLTHIDRLNQIEAREAMRETAAALRGIREELTGGWLTTDVDDLRIMFDTTNDNARQLLKLMGEIEAAKTIEGRAAAVKAFRDHIESTTSSWQNAESAAGKNFDAIVQMDDRLRQILHQMGLMPATTALATIELQKSNQELARAQEYGALIRQQWADRAAWAGEESARLNAEAEMNRLIALHGADSVAVTTARVQAERDAYAAIVATRVGANDLADGLMEAWDRANGVASVDMNGNITLAEGATWSWADAMSAVAVEINGIAAAIASLGGGLISNASKLVELKALEAGKSAEAAARERKAFDINRDYDGRVANAANPWEGLVHNIGRQVDLEGLDIDERLSAGRSAARERDRSSSGRGGRGGSDADTPAKKLKEQREALEELVKTEKQQIAMLLETDPLQRELLRNHEALAAAVPKEREEVEALIAERMKLETIKEKVDEIGRVGEQAFAGFVTGAHSFSDALSMVLQQLAQMAASEAWASLWTGGSGKTGGGGLSRIVMSALGLADGGRVSGPGGPREDLIPAWLSNGEYVVNAAATAEHLPLIEKMNAGASAAEIAGMIAGARPAWPTFADGGRMGNGSSAPSGWGLSGTRGTGQSGGGAGVKVDVSVRAYFDDRQGKMMAEVERVAQEVSTQVTTEGIEMFSNYGLPGRMAEIDAHPRVTG